MDAWSLVAGHFDTMPAQLLARRLVRGAIVNRTYCTHKKLYIYVFILTIFGPIYYGPRQ